MKTIPFFVAVSCAFFWAYAACAAPFAPLVEIPDDISKSDISFLEAQTVKKSVVPNEQEVGVPAYPGAKILFTQSGNRTSVNGITTLLPNRIFLGTQASFSKVVDFYTESLEDWSRKKENGSVVFFNKTETDDPFADPTLSKIVVSPVDFSRNLMPEAQTTIDIYYHRQQQQE